MLTTLHFSWNGFNSKLHMSISNFEAAFGLWCLIGVQENPPKIGSRSKIINGSMCNIVVGSEQEELEFI